MSPVRGDADLWVVTRAAAPRGAGAPKAREGANRGLDGSSLPEKTRDATEAAERSDAAAGVDPGTETETGKGGIRNEE